MLLCCVKFKNIAQKLCIQQYLDSSIKLKQIWSVYDAYKYYNKCLSLQKQKYEKYKLSDKAQCIICYAQATVYNFCKQGHHDGICLDCVEKLKEYKCPICRNKLSITGNDTIKYCNYDEASDDTIDYIEQDEDVLWLNEIEQQHEEENEQHENRQNEEEMSESTTSYENE